MPLGVTCLLLGSRLADHAHAIGRGAVRIGPATLMCARRIDVADSRSERGELTAGPATCVSR